MSTQSQINDIAGTLLGKRGGEGYSTTYDSSLLVRIPRSLNRETYRIDNENLPFVGGDIWNAYEVSAITNTGRPVSGVMKIWCNADSKYHVESKSIKLYLNSFNMTPFGETGKECIKIIEDTVREDLSTLLETEVECKLFTRNDSLKFDVFSDYDELEDLVDLDNVDYSNDKLKKLDLSKVSFKDFNPRLKVRTNLLRSNCRVTNQPDWGDLFIFIKGNEKDSVFTLDSLASYIVSHRQVNHFHEEIVEMIFKKLYDEFNPKELMVCAMYTRRGGIDINPIRSTHEHLIPGAFRTMDSLTQKTLRQ